MCELYASNAASPRDVSAQLRAFYSHSTLHPHGWGLALRGTFHNVTPECEARIRESGQVIHTDDLYMIKGSQCALEASQLTQRLEEPVVAERTYGHIRFASCGQRSIHNAHPFIGRFAAHNVLVMHNGTLFDTTMLDEYYAQRHGDTDSELIALHITRMLETWPLEKRGRYMADMLTALSHGDANASGNIPTSLRTLAREKNRAINKVNLICDDGTYTYAHTNTLAPTLFFLEEKECTYISTTPLDDKKWQELERGCVYMWHKGKLVWVSKSHGFLFEETEETSREALCSVHD